MSPSPIKFVLHKMPEPIDPTKKYKIVVHDAYWTATEIDGMSTAEYNIIFSLEEGPQQS